MNFINNIELIEIIQKYEHYEKVINFNSTVIRFIHECFCTETSTSSPHPSKSELVNIKMQELTKKYNLEKKLILNHPLATKQMKRDQMKALNQRYATEKRLLRQAK